MKLLSLFPRCSPLEPYWPLPLQMTSTPSNGCAECISAWSFTWGSLYDFTTRSTSWHFSIHTCLQTWEILLWIKRTSHMCSIKLSLVLRDLGFTQCESDHSIFLYHTPSCHHYHPSIHGWLSYHWQWFTCHLHTRNLLTIFSISRILDY